MEPQRPMKKRCPMCSSSNPLTASSCEVCGCGFNATQQTQLVSPSGSMSAMAEPAPAPSRQSRPATVVQSTPKRASQSNQSQSTQQTQPKRTALVPVSQPQPPIKTANKPGDLASLLASSNAAPAQAQHVGSQPLLGIWMMISLVVIVIAVLVTAAFFMSSTINSADSASTIYNSAPATISTVVPLSK